MKMTIQQTVGAIRAMGLSCVWSAEWKEFRINYRPTDARYKGDDTRTYADSFDAIGTARAMAAAGQNINTSQLAEK